MVLFFVGVICLLITGVAMWFFARRRGVMIVIFGFRDSRRIPQPRAGGPSSRRNTPGTEEPGD